MALEGMFFSPADGERVAADQLRLLADANIIGVVVATEHAIVEANDAFLSMIGCSRADVHGGIDWRAITPAEYAELDDLALDELRTRGTCTPFEKELVRRDGGRVAVQIGAARLESEPLRCICFVQDVSTRRQVEIELRQAAAASELTSRAKDDFANMVVHELRQPIATMVTAMLVLKSTLRADSQRTALARPLEVLDKQIANLTRLTDELLLASKIVRGAMPLRHGDVDMTAVVEEVVRDEQLRAEATGLTLLLERGERRAIVNGDALRLRQVVSNLVGNAIKYTRPGGEIRVAVNADASGCTLRVRDSGIGIAAGELPYVFEPFHRATREGSGFGLGLAVVRSIARQHGGSVGIFSDGPDRGTEVVVTLPGAAAPR